jgi:transglutaminase-like putative cysteine protease
MRRWPRACPTRAKWQPGGRPTEPPPTWPRCARRATVWPTSRPDPEHRATAQRYGNCTDFHALFISLARSEGIPSRFDIGFPVRADASSGEIGGYHCWVEFHLPGSGWFPIDASEAHKHPEHRELYYGTQPTDRIHFTSGRDLKLGPEHRDAPLNYFVYPYVEVAGKAWNGSIAKRFRYRDVAAP